MDCRTFPLALGALQTESVQLCVTSVRMVCPVTKLSVWNPRIYQLITGHPVEDRDSERANRMIVVIPRRQVVVGTTGVLDRSPTAQVLRRVDGRSQNLKQQSPLPFQGSYPTLVPYVQCVTEWR
jgi:hypothetical protein